MKETDQKVIHSIVKQWNGGEHMLAGARASEAIYADRTKPNEKLQDAIVKDAPGIERYLSAPIGGAVVETVTDQGGDPLSKQPENGKEATGESNQSGDAAKGEQDEIDKKLEPGRKARAKAAGKSEAKTDFGSTKLNPDADQSDAA